MTLVARPKYGWMSNVLEMPSIVMADSWVLDNEGRKVVQCLPEFNANTSIKGASSTLCIHLPDSSLDGSQRLNRPTECSILGQEGIVLMSLRHE